MTEKQELSQNSLVNECEGRSDKYRKLLAMLVIALFWT